jgi:hypothetical protein
MQRETEYLSRHSLEKERNACRNDSMVHIKDRQTILMAEKRTQCWTRMYGWYRCYDQVVLTLRTPILMRVQSTAQHAGVTKEVKWLKTAQKYIWVSSHLSTFSSPKIIPSQNPSSPRPVGYSEASPLLSILGLVRLWSEVSPSYRSRICFFSPNPNH